MIKNIVLLILIFISLFNYVKSLGQNSNFFPSKIDSFIVDTFTQNKYSIYNMCIRRKTTDLDGIFTNDTIYFEYKNADSKIIFQKYKSYYNVLETNSSIDNINYYSYNNNGLKSRLINYDTKYKLLTITFYYYNDFDSINRIESFNYSKYDFTTFKLNDWNVGNMSYSNNNLEKKFKFKDSSNEIVCYGYIKYDTIIKTKSEVFYAKAYISYETDTVYDRYFITTTEQKNLITKIDSSSSIVGVNNYCIENDQRCRKKVNYYLDKNKIVQADFHFDCISSSDILNISEQYIINYFYKNDVVSYAKDKLYYSGGKIENEYFYKYK